MEMQELWEKACTIMSEDMNPISYQTWIGGNLTPVRMVGDTLTLLVQLENLKSVMAPRYTTPIKSALEQVAGQPIKIELLTKSEWQAVRNEEVAPEP